MTRRTLARWLPILTLLGAVACGEESGQGSSNTGGSGGTADASAGAGGLGGSAGTDDAGTDAGCKEAGPVSLQVKQFSQDLSGYVVLFHHADGSVAQEMSTDSEGKVSGTLECGGLVTLAVGTDVLWTVQAAPGDAIVFDGGVPADTLGIGDMQLEVAQSFAGASAYPVGCVGPPSDLPDITGGLKLAIRKFCLNDAGNFHELAMAIDKLGDPLAFTYLKDITPAAPALTTVTLPMPWRTDFSTFQVNVSNAPPQFNGVSASVRPWLDGLNYYPHGSGVILKGGAGTLALQYPTGFGSMLQTVVNLGSPGLELRRLRRFATPPASVALTAADFLPPLSNAVVDKTIPSRPVVSFQGDTTSADGIITSLSYQPSGANGTTWAVVLRPGTNSFQYPELPATLAAAAPTATTSYIGLEIAALASPDINGPRDFREHHVINAAAYSVIPIFEEVSVAFARNNAP